MRCPSPSVTLQPPRIRTSRARSRFQLPSDAGRHVDAYMPIYFTGMNNPQPHLLRFGGLEVPETRQACVSRFDRLRQPEAFPLLLEVQLTDRWRQLAKYQSLEPVEPDETVMSYGFPTEMAVPRSLVRGLRDTVLEGYNVDYLAPTGSIQKGLRVDGRSPAGCISRLLDRGEPCSGRVLVCRGFDQGGCYFDSAWRTKLVGSLQRRSRRQGVFAPISSRRTWDVSPRPSPMGRLIGQSQVELSIDKMMVVKGR